MLKVNNNHATVHNTALYYIVILIHLF